MTRPYRYRTLDVFTEEVFGGNPLAVFPEADGLSDADMARIARELNLSETVFVFPPDDPAHLCRLRIFTPGMELPFAGHPTVGTAVLLALEGRIPPGAGEASVVLEEPVGPVPVTVRAGADGRAPFATLTAARAPEFRDAADRATLAALLSLAEGDVRADRFSPRAASCGVAFQFIPLASRDALARARVDLAVWERAIAPHWAPHVMPYVVEEDGATVRVRARMFAPAMGIAEDPATGGAASALAGLLAVTLGVGDGRHGWEMLQGVEMGRPSRLWLEADVRGGAVTAARVGGSAVPVAEGVFHVPEEPR